MAHIRVTLASDTPPEKLIALARVCLYRAGVSLRGGRAPGCARVRPRRVSTAVPGAPQGAWRRKPATR